MTLPARLASGFVVILLVMVGALTGVTLHFRTQRNDALAAVARLRATVQADNRQVPDLEQQVQSLNEQVDSLSTNLDGLNGQIEWDKSHLLDCWVIIKRIERGY